MDLGHEVLVKCQIFGADVAVQKVFGMDHLRETHELGDVGLCFGKQS
jgi:hypothetical protein